LERGVTGAWGFLGEAVLHWRGRHVLMRRSAYGASDAEKSPKRS
jgi:hypothetical protein